VLCIPAGLAAEATVCAQLLHTVARGDNLILEGPLRNWAEELRRRWARVVAPTMRLTTPGATPDVLCH
jgi:hypothetical protein